MITASRLRELVVYDPATGVFTWRVNVGSRGRAGNTLGTYDAYGYLVVTLDQREYKLHRLAWLYVYGVWPTQQIDHLGARDDNRIHMLREASHFENEQHRGMNRNNKSGHKGVSWCRTTTKWRAVITAFGKTKDLGRFDTVDEAARAYKDAAAELHGEFSGV